jgi:ring-1,2-phenylacetyl-CoA epoxidase subunit PaaE
VHLRFHPLRICAREPAADDAVALTLEVPKPLRETYAFLPGQHVAIRAMIAGREQRRTYSLVGAPGTGELRLGIRVQPPGGLAHHLACGVRIGEHIEVLGPTGSFFRATEPDARRQCLALAAGVGITPVLSIVRAILVSEPGSRVSLIYGNRTSARTMFLEELLALKNHHLGRLALHFIMSREPQDHALFDGRLDAAKLQVLAGVLFDPAGVDEVYICGPGDLAATARAALAALGSTAPIHSEQFMSAAEPAPRAVATAGASPTPDANAAVVTVVQDGRRRSFPMLPSDASVLDAAERAGLELPFSCRSGVCSTCRARLVRGTATMAHNVALEDWELAAGYVLCCQLHPTGGEVELSYDEK